MAVSQSNPDVSTHSRPKAAVDDDAVLVLAIDVSTHSRPKAAANVMTLSTKLTKFQHTAARRRLVGQEQIKIFCSVSTHSRPKAAEMDFILLICKQ